MRLHPPVILLTGHGDVSMVLRALKAGALTVDRNQRSQMARLDQWKTALAALSTREREVLERMVVGAINKVIAQDLGISERTLEKHRKHILEKLGMRSLAELIRAVVLHESRQEGEERQ